MSATGGRVLAAARGSRSPSRMLEGSQLEALSCLKDVRWPLLESYALARQEGLVDPVGLVIDGT